MAIPTFVSAGTFVTSATTSNPGAPGSSVADDIWIYISECSGADTPVAPTGDGYTAFPDLPITSGSAASDTQLMVSWKRVANGETAPSALGDPGSHYSSQILCFRGCITTGNPYDVTANAIDTSTDNSGAVPGDTTTVDDCLIVLIATSALDATSTTEFSGWTNGDLANITEITDNIGAADNGGGFGVATGEKATAGAFGDTAVTYANNSKKSLYTIALKPPAAAASEGQQSVIIIGI